MRIALISYWTCPFMRLGVFQSGGMGAYIQYLVSNLGQVGHQVDIYTRVHHGNEEKIVTINQNIKVIHYSVNIKNHQSGLTEFTQRMITRIKKEKIQYDLLHCHYYFSGMIGLEMSKILNIPNV